MANPLRNALKRKKELERELTEIDRFLAAYDRFATLSRNEPQVSESEPAANESPADSTRVGKKRGRPAEFVTVMEDIIRREFVPLQRAQLVEAVESLGYIIPSDDKPRYLGTILWRHREKFINVLGKGYMLADMMTPEEIEDARELSNLAGADDDVASVEGAENAAAEAREALADDMKSRGLLD